MEIRLSRWPVHDVLLTRFKRQAKRQRCRRRHVHPQDQDRRQRDQVPRQQRDDDQQSLRDVAGDNEQNGLFQVVVNPASLVHRAGNGGKVVIR